MTSLPSLLGTMTASLQAHPLCKEVSEVEAREFSDDQFLFKVRAELAGGNRLQVRIYYNGGHIDYAYQLFSDVPLLRWDNKEEFRRLTTYPHHHHDAQGNVQPSPLTGDPEQDIETVLQQAAQFLETSQRRVKPGPGKDLPDG